MAKKPERKNKKLLIIIISAILVAVVVIGVVIFKAHKNNQLQEGETETNWAVELSDAGLSPYNTSVKKPSSEGFTVDYINVEQGDCSLVTCNGKNMLIDCGEADYYEVVRNFLFDKGIEHLDIVISSHPHSDHIGGMSRLFEDFTVGTLLMPQVKENEELKNDTYKNFTNALDAYSVDTKYVTKGDVYYLSDAKITVLSPIKNMEEINNMSVVAMVEYGDNKLLFTGDVERKAEELMLADGIDIDCDILKVSHHGSKDSSSVEFINAASPEFAVISVAEYNEFNHPNGETLKTLLKEDVNIYRTDFDGTVSFYAGSPDSEIVCLTK